jgi:hypothetical protein
MRQRRQLNPKATNLNRQLQTNQPDDEFLRPWQATVHGYRSCTKVISETIQEAQTTASASDVSSQGLLALH